ncbi:MAG: hypothetical protein AB8B55_05640 [Mariniblastus sp.]
MTIKMDWRWWTYFKLENELVSAANVEEYDISSKRIRYRLEWEHDEGEEIEKPVEAKYVSIWINPSKSIALMEREIAALRDGYKPKSFIELIDTDPEVYFNRPKTLSNFFPDKLKKMVADLEGENKPET